MTRIATVLILLGLTPVMGGCLLGIAAGAGYVAGDEINEGDGKFDPLEDVRGKGNGKN